MPYKDVMRIRLSLWGCRNRPFFLIVAAKVGERRPAKFVEQLGSYDPLVNVHGEKLVSLKFNRVKHWLAYGATPTGGANDVLSLAGFQPARPRLIARAPFVKEFHEQMKLKEESEARTWHDSMLEKGLDPGELSILLTATKRHTPEGNRRKEILQKLLDAGFEKEEVTPPDPDYWDGTEPEFREMLHPRRWTVFEGTRPLGRKVTQKW